MSEDRLEKPYEPDIIKPYEPDIIRGIDKPDIGSSENSSNISPPPAPRPSTSTDKD